MLLPQSLLQDLALEAYCRHDIVKQSNPWSHAQQEGAAVAVQPVPPALMRAHTQWHYWRPVEFVSLTSQGLTRFTFFSPKELDFQKSQVQQTGDKFVSVVSQFITLASFSFSDVEDLLMEAKELVRSPTSLRLSSQQERDGLGLSRAHAVY